MDARTHTRARTHTFARACIHTRTRMRMHTHVRARIRTRTQGVLPVVPRDTTYGAMWYAVCWDTLYYVVCDAAHGTMWYAMRPWYYVVRVGRPLVPTGTMRTADGGQRRVACDERIFGRQRRPGQPGLGVVGVCGPGAFKHRAHAHKRTHARARARARTRTHTTMPAHTTQPQPRHSTHTHRTSRSTLPRTLCTSGRARSTRS
jgi:hypothetical protein